MSGCFSSAGCEVSKVINDSLKINTFPQRICRDSTVKFLLYSVGATQLNPHDLHFVSNLLGNEQLKQLETCSVTWHWGALQHSREKSETKMSWRDTGWAVLGVPGCRGCVPRTGNLLGVSMMSWEGMWGDVVCTLHVYRQAERDMSLFGKYVMFPAEVKVKSCCCCWGEIQQWRVRCLWLLHKHPATHYCVLSREILPAEMGHRAALSKVHCQMGSSSTSENIESSFIHSFSHIEIYHFSRFSPLPLLLYRNDFWCTGWHAEHFSVSLNDNSWLWTQRNRYLFSGLPW